MFKEETSQVELLSGRRGGTRIGGIEMAPKHGPWKKEDAGFCIILHSAFPFVACPLTLEFLIEV